MSTPDDGWEARMASRTAARREAREAAEKAEEARAYERLLERGLILPGEDPPGWQDWHQGHFTHWHESHFAHNVCSCGEARFIMAAWAIDPDAPEPETEPCPVCAARRRMALGRLATLMLTRAGGRRVITPAAPEALRWHFGIPDKTGAYMFCSGCGAEVYAFEEGYICSGCGRSEDWGE